MKMSGGQLKTLYVTLSNKLNMHQREFQVLKIRQRRQITLNHTKHPVSLGHCVNTKDTITTYKGSKKTQAMSQKIFLTQSQEQIEPEKKPFMTNSNENTYLQKKEKILKT